MLATGIVVQFDFVQLGEAKRDETRRGEFALDYCVCE